MKVLVIGGTLFIGRVLVEELVKGGHEVAVMHRKPKHDFGRRVENIMADRNDADAVREALSGRRFEVVFDNAYDWERGTTAAQVEATVRAVRRPDHPLHFHVQRGGLRRRPESQGKRSAGAGLPLRSLRPPKATTERMLFRMHASSGLAGGHLPSAVRLRAAQSTFYREQFFWDRLRAGRPIIIPGDGHRLMQFVYVNDLVQAMVRSMEEPKAVGEAFNIGDPKPLTQAELVEKLAQGGERGADAGPGSARHHRAGRRQRHGGAVLFRRVLRPAADHREHRQGDSRPEDQADPVRGRA